jgi:hypothetical protein
MDERILPERRYTFARFLFRLTDALIMKLRLCIAVVCLVLILITPVLADDLVSFSISPNGGLSFPQLPPSDGDSVMVRKITDPQPIIYKNSDHLKKEAERSRDYGNKDYQAFLTRYQQDLLQYDHQHYTIDEIKNLMFNDNDYSHPTLTPMKDFNDPVLLEYYNDAKDNYVIAQQQYSAALKATGDKDYTRQAAIFESASSMYANMGAKDAQEQVDNAALAARARAAVEGIPISPWVCVLAVIFSVILIKRKNS